MFVSFLTHPAAQKGALPPEAFLKMHGLGNDFVIFDRRKGGPPMTPAAAREIGDRRTGVGFDQLIVLTPADGADAGMEIWNPDGSLSGACGNATRCVADLIMTETGVDAAVLRTAAGDLACARVADGRIQVNMGPPLLDWREIPLAAETPTDAVDSALLPAPAQTLGAFGAVNMGNPHAVFFVDDADAAPVDALGPIVETAPLFPEKTNVEFISVLAPNILRMRVWERGAGITRACGSGACATVVAAARRGRCGPAATVRLDGGALDIEWASDGVYMTGPAAFSFYGLAGPRIFTPK